tara:strand:- start:5794 stop:6516 length:723 start_codon:yes stop_codon:yes gene_type:complete
MNIDLKDITGTFPSEPCVFAACDSKYFMDHASPFVNSASLAGKPVHIHVVNPTNDCLLEAKRLENLANTPVTFTGNVMEIPDDPDAMKCTYASLRFFVLPYLLEKIEKIMVLDIDCMVMRDFEFPDKPCGLFVRQPVTYLSDWIKEGTKIAAGIVYFDRSYIDKTKKLIEIINSLPRTWYADQVALNKLLVEHINHEDVFVFGGNFMDWNFLDGTVIWTGKGKSKTDNPRYVSMKKRMTV